MKRFILKHSSTVIFAVGALCLLIAAAIWYQGSRDSRDARRMAENLGKDYAGEGWYPTNGTRYDLEARIVGHKGWVTQALNAERGDQIEVRLCVASSDDMQLTMSANMLTGRLVLSNRPNGGRISGVLNSADLKWAAGATAIYDSPDVMHVAYVPVGIYTIEDDIWSRAPGADTIGVFYDSADGQPIYRDILIVPPYSEVDFRAVRRFALAGVVCSLILAPVMAFGYHWYEKKKGVTPEVG